MTGGQRKLLTQALLGPVEVVGEVAVRFAESLVFRKWVTMDGNIKSKVATVNITDAGRKALELYVKPKRRKE